MISTITYFDLVFESARPYLANFIPKNWEQLSDDQQLEFVKANLWEPLEYKDPENVLDKIYDGAGNLQNLLERNEIELADSNN